MIDFAGVGMGDPACDLLLAWNLLPRAARKVFRAELGVDDATWDRGRGWALSVAVIQLPYYEETNPTLAANARHVIREVLADHRCGSRRGPLVEAGRRRNSSERSEMVEEARLEQLDAGLTPVTDGWFVVNIPDAAWVTNAALGAACIFEGDDAPFPDLGFTIAVLQPGQSGGRYHREANQEDFLVLAGECLLLIEGEERPLRAWDFVHCPPHTEHGFVGAGDGPCVIFMTGARKGWPKTGVVYPRSEPALRHGAGVEAETTSSAEAYAPFPKWQPGPPESWAGLPWAK